MADIDDVGSSCKAAQGIIVVFALSFISSSYVADSNNRFLWHSLESIRIRRDILSRLCLS